MRAARLIRSAATRRGAAATAHRSCALPSAIAVVVPCRYCCPLAAAASSRSSFATPVRRFSAASAPAGGVSTDMLLSMAMQSAEGPPATSQAELVAQLKKSGLIQSPRVEAAMSVVDRKHFARLPSGSAAASAASPYANASAAIGQCSTISSPASHAQALEALAPFLPVQGPGSQPIAVLDVGSGSGYLTACIAHMLQRSEAAATATAGAAASLQSQASSGGLSEVVGLEHSAVLLDQSRANLARDPATAVFLDPNPRAGVRVSFVHASAAAGSSLAWASSRPALFDVIHAGAAFASMPRHLLPLLKVGGVMIVPVAKSDAAGLTASDAASQAGVEQMLMRVRVTSRGADGSEQISSEVIHPCSFAPIKQQSVENNVTRAAQRSAPAARESEACGAVPGPRSAVRE